MKNSKIIFVATILFYASCAHKLTNSKYTAIEPWKEWEIEILFNSDSTFSMTDSFGCNRFNYSGRWHYNNNKDSNLSFIIFNDTTHIEYDKSHDIYLFYDKKTQTQKVVRAIEYFPVISNDTAWVLNSKQIRFRGLTFGRKRKGSKYDLGKERVKLIEHFYINKIGRTLFVKTFGNGISIKEARKNISDCNRTNPIPNVELGKNIR